MNYSNALWSEIRNRKYSDIFGRTLNGEGTRKRGFKYKNFQKNNPENKQRVIRVIVESVESVKSKKRRQLSAPPLKQFHSTPVQARTTIAQTTS